MTVGAAGDHKGLLCRVVREEQDARASSTLLSRDSGRSLTPISRRVQMLPMPVPLNANSSLAARVSSYSDQRFIVTPRGSRFAWACGRIPELTNHIRPYRNGRDIKQVPRNVMVIDLLGLDEHEVQVRFPEVFQWL